MDKANQEDLLVHSEASAIAQISAVAGLAKYVERKCEARDWDSHVIADIGISLFKNASDLMKILNKKKRNNGTNNGHDTNDPLETNA